MKIKKHPNGNYYAHLTGSNPVNLKTKSIEEAKKLAAAAKLEELEFAAKAKLLTAEVVTRLSAGGNKVTNSQALEMWEKWTGDIGLAPRTVEQHRITLLRFFRETKLKDKTPSSVTADHVNTFVNPDNELSRSTRTSRHSSLASFFTFAVSRCLCVSNPVALVPVKLHLLSHSQKEPKPRQPFTPAELKLLSELDDPFWRPAVLLALETGLRVGDIATLEWACLSKPGVITVWTDKRDRRVTLPLSAELAAMLRAIPIARTSPENKYIFPMEAARQMTSRRHALSMGFSRQLAKLGIDGKSFHCLRHTFATERSSLGETVDEIRAKLGHVSSETTERYVHSR